MKRKNLIIAATIAIIGASVPAQAITLVQWNFNDGTTTGGTLVPNINANAGTVGVSLVGGTTATFAQGTGSSDPLGTSNQNRAYNTATYPAQSTASGTAGIEFKFSTLGAYTMQLSFDRRSSASASRWIDVRLSTDGGATYNSLTNLETPNNLVTMTPSGAIVLPASANNKADVRVRMVSIFGTIGAVGGTQYFSVGNTAGGSAAQYGASGTIRYDMVTVNASAVPEPSAFIAVGLGVLGLVARRRK